MQIALEHGRLVVVEAAPGNPADRYRAAGLPGDLPLAAIARRRSDFPLIGVGVITAGPREVAVAVTHGDPVIGIAFHLPCLADLRESPSGPSARGGDDAGPPCSPCARR